MTGHTFANRVTSWLTPWLLALIPFALFIAVATHDLALPGFYGDEALQISPAVDYIRGDEMGLTIDGLPETRFTIADRSISLMTMRYIGALKTLLFVPFAAAFGNSIYIVRFFTVGIAAIAVLATYFFTATLFSRSSAIVASLLLALDQSFMLRTRVDWGPNAIAITFKMLALLCFALWWRYRRRRYLALGGVLSGLTLYNKSDFAYMLAALVIATGLVYFGEIRRTTRRVDWFWLVGAFLVGSAVYIWYNLISSLGAFRDGNPDHIAWWHPAVFFAALRIRVERLFELLDGSSMDAPIGVSPWSIQFSALSGIVGGLFVAALVVALIIAARLRSYDQVVVQAFRWLLIVIGLFLLACAITPAAFAHHHVINVYPFPHILIGAACTAGIAQFTRHYAFVRRFGKAIVACVLVAAFGSDAILMNNTYTALERVGGAGHWSDAIYRVATDIRATRSDAPMHLMDWGILEPLTVLLDGDVRGIDEPWPGLMDAANVDTQSAALLANSRALYVVPAPEAQAFPRAWRSLQAYAGQHGMHAQTLATYNRRDSVPVYLLYRFAPANDGPVATFSTSVTLTAAVQPKAGMFFPTIIAWDTNSDDSAQLYVSVNGGTEMLFAQGRQGNAYASWVQPNLTYVFRLYAGTMHQVVLREVTVYQGG